MKSFQSAFDRRLPDRAPPAKRRAITKPTDCPSCTPLMTSSGQRLLKRSGSTLSTPNRTSLQPLPSSTKARLRLQSFFSTSVVGRNVICRPELKQVKRRRGRVFPQNVIQQLPTGAISPPLQATSSPPCSPHLSHLQRQTRT